MSIASVARAYKKYYADNGAEILESAPLIHPLFPMSFNMSAGLVQLDPLLRQRGKLSNRKMVVVQKCFRHFDISRVTDFSHLSFFEMGGYFEVGTIDRRQLMSNLYHLLVDVYHVDRRKIWITTFSGGDIFGHQFNADLGMVEVWQGLLDGSKRITSYGAEHNFWTQGGGTEIAIDSKLCGSQTEVFYDLTGAPCNRNEKCLPNCDCGRFLEISNNLFITHKITRDLHVVPLANQAVESVVGIERLCAVLEEKQTVFLVKDIQKLKLALVNNVSAQTEEIRLNRVVDHLRSLFFLVPEGAPKPGRNGRARIIRTLMRELLADLYVLKLNVEISASKILSLLSDIYMDRYTIPAKSTLVTLTALKDHQGIYQQTLLKAGRAMKRFLVKSQQEQLNNNDRDFFHRQYGIPLELQDIYLSGQE